MGEEPMIVTEKRHHLHIGLELTSAVVKLILTINNIIEKLLTPRSVFTLLFFATLCYMLLNDKPIPQLLNTICSSLLAFYFGEKTAKYKIEEMKNGNKEES